MIKFKFMKAEKEDLFDDKRRSYLVSLFLTIFLGPIGLFYSSVLFSIGMLAVMVPGLHELYSQVINEPFLFDAYLKSEQYASTVGELVIFWVACTPIGLGAVFFLNRTSRKEKFDD